VQEDEARVLGLFQAQGVPCARIGTYSSAAAVSVRLNGHAVLQAAMPALRDAWEATSFALEMRQCDPALVRAEQQGLKSRASPPHRCAAFVPTPTEERLVHRAPSQKPRVAVLREVCGPLLAAQVGG
jgi:phosphoribosylformylglycinamidine synthase